jgi:hypothetical protein
VKSFELLGMVGRPRAVRYLTDTLLNPVAALVERDDAHKLIEIFDRDQAMTPVERVAVNRDFSRRQPPIKRSFGQPGSPAGLVGANKLREIWHQFFLSWRMWPPL